MTGAADAVAQLIARMDRQHPGLAWAQATVDEDAPLLSAEALAVERAVPARRAEFRMGRLAARRALARVGVRDCAVPMGPDRAPIWPAGLVGSISHHNDMAVAVIGLAADCHGIGVDLDEDTPLAPDLIAEICRPEETATDMPRYARRVFSAKEAAYKAQFRRHRTVFGFHGLHVDFDTGLATWPDHADTGEIPSESRVSLPLLQLEHQRWLLSLCVWHKELT